jgi:hypothetical protein
VVVEAIIGLIGVLVGAIISVGAQYAMRLRDERAEARTAARLIYEELANTAGQLTIFALATREKRQEFLSAQGFSSEEWDERRAVLARVLSPDEWLAVHRAYRFASQISAVARLFGGAPGRIVIELQPHVKERLSAAQEVVARRAQMPAALEDKPLEFEMMILGDASAGSGGERAVDDAARDDTDDQGRDDADGP